MAALTVQQLRRARNGCETAMPLGYTKEHVNAALQAIEDWWELPATKAAISSAIDTATSPFVFTNAQKKKIGKFWLLEKFGVE